MTYLGLGQAVHDQRKGVDHIRLDPLVDAFAELLDALQGGVGLGSIGSGQGGLELIDQATGLKCQHAGLVHGGNIGASKRRHCWEFGEWDVWTTRRITAS